MFNIYPQYRKEIQTFIIGKRESTKNVLYDILVCLIQISQLHHNQLAIKCTLYKNCNFEVLQIFLCIFEKRHEIKEKRRKHENI